MKTKEELTKIFEESKEKLYSLAYRLVGNKEDALDIVQETFLRSLSSLKRFREGSSLYTWLYRITYNLSLDWLRQMKKKRKVGLRKNVSGIEKDNPAKFFHRKETSEMLKIALDQLSAKQKAVVSLRTYEELPYKQISQILRCRVGTAKAHYFFGLKNLRKILKGRDELSEV